MRQTCVFFHAHPDDEALLTAGTMAMLAAQGHRVVVVVATAGEAGLTADPARGSELGQVRLSELNASALALGCVRVITLGYADSGLNGDENGERAFAAADVEEAAARLADVLKEENATLLTTYDESGGYGHPDHVQVHRVGSRAAELAGTPVVLEATVDRGLLRRALRLVGAVYRFPPEFDPATFDTAYTATADITHRVNVRRYARAKRASMAAHATQASGGESERTLGAFLRLPYWLFRFAFGTEWYRQRGLPAGAIRRHPLETRHSLETP